MLQEPWPFGAGKVIKAHADGRLDIQWLGNGTNSVRNALHVGWRTSKGVSV
jgi:hypothetical protein